MIDINTRPIQLATGIFKLEGSYMDLGSLSVIMFFAFDTPVLLWVSRGPPVVYEKHSKSSSSDRQ